VIDCDRTQAFNEQFERIVFVSSMLLLEAFLADDFELGFARQLGRLGTLLAVEVF